MSMSPLEHQILDHAHRHHLLTEAAERRRVSALPGQTLRARLARTLVALAVRLAPATAEAQPTASAV